MSYFTKVFLSFLFCLFFFGNLSAQDSLAVLDYSDSKKYELGGVTVKGAQNSDPEAVKAVTGLQAGTVISIPGQEITDAINSLMGLNLFADVTVTLDRTVGEIAFITILLEEKPRYARHNYKGVKKRFHDDLNEILNKYLAKGSIVTDNVKRNIENGMEKYFVDKGYLDASANIDQNPDPVLKNGTQLTIHVDRKSKVKIKDIMFTGNHSIKARKLRKQMKETRRKRRIFAKSRFLQGEYESDKQNIIDYYRSQGYRDMKINSDSIWRNDKGELMIAIDIQEGDQYYFRNIDWRGNTLYSDEVLTNVLGIQKGDVYNLEELNERLTFSLETQDVSALYMDDGYLFFRVEPVEVAIVEDSIDIEMRIFEGPQANIERVVIRGNDRTHEHVIRRILRTTPGEKFSRSDIIRSQRELQNLGYFDPEQMGINTPVNPQRYTVDIEYDLVERPNDQLELSAGWGGIQGLFLTLGVTFNNFSIRNLLEGKAWKPLPVGDGQRLSLRAQTNGVAFQSYNASFTEPWLGGKKPNSFTVGGAFTRIGRRTNFFTNDISGKLDIFRAFVGLGTRLRWPDDNFLVNFQLSYANYNLDNFGTNAFNFRGEQVDQGRFNDINLQMRLVRTSINEPIFPTGGSEISLTATFTPPYSVFRAKDYYDDLSIQDQFKFLEYHKWRIDAEWYQTLVGKLVFRAAAKIGILDSYNERAGLYVFERFALGGGALDQQQGGGVIGFDPISLRGYDVQDIEVNANAATLGRNFRTGTATVFNKYTMELRYPISLNPSATIFVLGFAEGGNAWDGLENFNPFELKRSAGLGLRVFLPMFGLLGFDYGIGFDKPNLHNTNARWSEYGTFQLILGFEPE